MAEQSWNDVKFYFSGDGYFASVLESIRQAATEVRVEMYMFNFDELGEKVLQSLKEARERGVKVYLLVDGIGTVSFLNEVQDFCKKHHIHFKIYHPLPFRIDFLSRFSIKALTWKSIRHFFLLFRKMNNRDHRKIFLIDQQVAYLGSQNVNKCHSESLAKDEPWRDTGVRLEGPPVATLVDTSKFAWEKAKSKRLIHSWRNSFNVLRLSARRKHRLARIRELISSFDAAKERIWITTAYFVPNRKILRSLEQAARRGVDVALCLPAQTDVPFMKWTAWLLYDRLITAGVKIYEYQNRVLHAKSMIVDDWGTVGSYNFNHRSLIHDLEVEAVIDKPQWLKSLEQQWIKDISNSKKVDQRDKGHSNIFLKGIANIFYFFRYWI